MPFSPYDPKSAAATGNGPAPLTPAPVVQHIQPTRNFRGDVQDQASMLALTDAAQSDWIRRMDLGGQIFELIAPDYTQLANWKAYPLNYNGYGTPTPLVNDLSTGGDTSALTASQGKVLKGLVDQAGSSANTAGQIAQTAAQTATDANTTATQAAVSAQTASSTATTAQQSALSAASAAAAAASAASTAAQQAAAAVTASQNAAAAAKLPVPTAFTPVLQFDGLRSLATHVMTGPIAFSAAASPADGAQVKASIQPNGVDVPTFPPGWQKWDGSNPYSQTNFNVLYADYTAVGTGLFSYGWNTGALVTVATTITVAPSLASAQVGIPTSATDGTATGMPAPGILSRQWQSSAPTATPSFSTISGATSAAYTPVTADTGNYLRRADTYSSSVGAAVTTFSNYVTVAAAALAKPTAPAVNPGSASATGIAGTITLGVGSSQVDQFLLFYKQTSQPDSAYVSGGTVPYTGSTNTAFSIAGLGSGLSYSVQAYSNNASGNSPVSNTLVESTTAPPVSGITAAFTGTDGTDIIGTTTDTGGAIWAFWGGGGGNHPVIKSNAASVSDFYAFGGAAVTTPTVSGTGTLTLVSGDASVIACADPTNLVAWRAGLRGLVPYVEYYYLGNGIVCFTASAPVAAGAHTLSLNLTGGLTQDGTGSGGLSFSVDGTVLYTTPDRVAAARAVNASSYYRGELPAYGFSMESGGVVDDFSYVTHA